MNVKKKMWIDKNKIIYFAVMIKILLKFKLELLIYRKINLYYKLLIKNIIILIIINN